jgi:hypothetical protein
MIANDLATGNTLDPAGENPFTTLLPNPARAGTTAGDQAYGEWVYVYSGREVVPRATGYQQVFPRRAMMSRGYFEDRQIHLTYNL